MEDPEHTEEALPPAAPPPTLLARIFYSPDEFRLRAGWRLLLFGFVLLLVFSFAGVLVFLLRDASLFDNIGVMLALQMVAITAAVLFARRLIDLRSFSSLGLSPDRRSFPDLLAGFLLGGIIMGGIYLFFLSMGWLNVQGYAWQSVPVSRILIAAATILLSVGLFIGWSEELVFRGYLFENLKDGLHLPAAVILTSLFFGLVHAGNPFANWNALIGIFLAGFMLAYGRLCTGQLWLPIGLHAGWNFFQAMLGFPVSGIDVFHLIRVSVAGPALVTGGEFGPEAGIVIIPAALLGIGGIYLWGRFFRKKIDTQAQTSAF